MLRAFIAYLASAQWARRIITGWRLSRRVAARFVAGDTLDEAVGAIKILNDKGMFATLDHLGEHVSTPEESVEASDAYLALLKRISQDGLKASVSLKLTQLGLLLDPDLCFQNVRRVAEQARLTDSFVRIDMEDSSAVDQTLELFSRLRQEGYMNVGVVIQSYLFRSDQDLERLLEIGARIRLVKGAYDEPPDIAYPRKSDVDASFDRETAMIIRAAIRLGAAPASDDGRHPPITAVGTHDEARIEFARKEAEAQGLPQRCLEFQLLFGIRSELQESLVELGYPVRIYVPYGTEWYPYFMRRLAERPANVWFFISNFFRR